MFPESHDFPPGVLQFLRRVDVSGHISDDFLFPVISICLGEGEMLIASVPKTSIDENCNLQACERDVHGAALVAG